MSRDPIGERGGVNLYGFVGNDGLTGVDALGQYNMKDLIWIIISAGTTLSDLASDKKGPYDVKPPRSPVCERVVKDMKSANEPRPGNQRPRPSPGTGQRPPNINTPSTGIGTALLVLNPWIIGVGVFFGTSGTGQAPTLDMLAPRFETSYELFGRLDEQDECESCCEELELYHELGLEYKPLNFCVYSFILVASADSQKSWIHASGQIITECIDGDCPNDLRDFDGQVEFEAIHGF